MVCTASVFANRHARAGGDARPYNSSGTGAEFAAERIVTHDMMARRVSLYIRYPPSHGRGVGDAAPYGWAGDGRCGIVVKCIETCMYMYVSATFTA